MERKLRATLRNGTFGNVSEVRSRNMGAIRGKGNRTTEARLRGMLVRARIRGWEMHPRTVKGKPDFFFPRNQVVVFVDGCFWHGCPRCGHIPGANRRFWKAKIRRNRERDRVTDRLIWQTGLISVRFWEHELKDSPKKCMQRLVKILKGSGRRRSASLKVHLASGQNGKAGHRKKIESALKRRRGDRGTSVFLAAPSFPTVWRCGKEVAMRNATPNPSPT
jgi:DNA mismatch endonuclease (patch repair protein)